MYWSAVISGLLAPVLLAAILYVATDRKSFAGHPVPRFSLWVLGFACLLMTLAGVGMFVF